MEAAVGGGALTAPKLQASAAKAQAATAIARRKDVLVIIDYSAFLGRY
jgi:hypothetical protein